MPFLYERTWTGCRSCLPFPAHSLETTEPATFYERFPRLLLCLFYVFRYPRRAASLSGTQWHHSISCPSYLVLHITSPRMRSQGEISNPIPHFVLISRFSHLEKARIFSQRKTEERRREKGREGERRRERERVAARTLCQSRQYEMTTTTATKKKNTAGAGAGGEDVVEGRTRKEEGNGVALAPKYKTRLNTPQEEYRRRPQLTLFLFFSSSSFLLCFHSLPFRQNDNCCESCV